MLEKFKSIGNIKDYVLQLPGIFYANIFLILVFSIMNPRFLSGVNMHLIARHSSVLIVASIGMTMAILVSQVDLSIGSVMSLSGVVTAVSFQNGMSITTSIILGIMTGILIGLVNGILVAVYKFDYWITTFATMGIAAGLALVIAGGETIAIKSEILNWFGNGKLFNIYALIYMTVIMLTIVTFILRRTKFGYIIYSIGGSEQCAKLSGISVVKNRIFVYICSGFFAAIAGLMLTSMGDSASPIAGANYSFEAIAAVIIGGTSFDGGKGGLRGTIMGALMLRILTSGLNLMGVPATWQQAIIGITIIVLLVADALNERLKKKNEMRRYYTDA